MGKGQVGRVISSTQRKSESRTTVKPDSQKGSKNRHCEMEDEDNRKDAEKEVGRGDILSLRSLCASAVKDLTVPTLGGIADSSAT